LSDGRSTPEEIHRFVAAYVTSGNEGLRDPDDGGRVPRDYPGRSPLEHFQSVVDLLGEPRISTDHGQRFAIGAAVDEPTEQGRRRKGGREERRADRQVAQLSATGPSGNRAEDHLLCTETPEQKNDMGLQTIERPHSVVVEIQASIATDLSPVENPGAERFAPGRDAGDQVARLVYRHPTQDRLGKCRPATFPDEVVDVERPAR